MRDTKESSGGIEGLLGEVERVEWRWAEDQGLEGERVGKVDSGA